MSVQATPSEFERFRQFLESASGIRLDDSKTYLVNSRLRPILNAHNQMTLSQLLDALGRPGGETLKNQVVEAMTTNETLWFRDTHPFDLLKSQLLPELWKNDPNKTLRFWSAACSTGQEPYSISMTVDEYQRSNPAHSKAQIRIVGTDISSDVLDRAKQATYDDLSLTRGLSQERRNRYFEAQEGEWRIKEAYRRQVSFKPLNLLNEFVGIDGPFDVVFCRNVLIYFSPELKQAILKKIRSVLKPGGYLMIGSTESMRELSDCFELVHNKPGMYYRAI